MSENNGWIKCKDRLPEVFDHNGVMRSDIVICFGIIDPDYGKTYEFGYVNQDNKFCDAISEFTAITHWRPLPQPPID